MNTWKPILAALVIFAAGVMTGGLTVKLRPLRPLPANQQGKKTVAAPREAQLRELSRRMQSELDLNPDQREHVEAIIHDSQERMKKLREDVGQKIGEEFREMRQKIRSELTPDQRKKFIEIMKQHDERNKRDARPVPPPTEKSE